MEAKHLLLLFLIFAVASPGTLHAQRQAAAPPDSEAPLLTLDDAVSLALTNNRLVKNSALEAQKFDFQLRTAKSRRLPQFQFAALGGELLHSFDFTFPAGAFGTYPNVGPIPGKEAKVHTPARFTTYLTGAFDQPLTQLYKINLGVHATELGREIASEETRAERQKIAAAVRTAYFELEASQARVDASQQTVVALTEAKQVTARYHVEQTVFEADVLEVDARFAKSVYELSVSENALATQREHLNQLLGRDLNTAFRVPSMPEEEANTMKLDEARRRAAENRPEIRQARLKMQQAEYDRRIARADYIPDLSLSVRYQGINNVQVLPANVTTAGFLFTWEPFDWGRKRDRVAEKTITVEQARNGREETGSQIAVEIGMKYRKFREAALLLAAARARHAAAAEEFRVTTNKYQEAAALIKDLLQAQARSAETESAYQQALSSYWGALADLRQAMGDE